MNTTTRSVHIDAPPAAVWAVLADVRRMPELSPSTESVDAPASLTAVGDRFRQVVRLAGRRFTSDWEVVAIEPGRRLVVAGSVLPGTRYEMDESVTPHLDGTGTTLTLTMRWKLPFGPLGRLAGRLGAERRAVDEAEGVLDGVRRLAEAQPQANLRLNRAGKQRDSAAGSGVGGR